MNSGVLGGVQVVEEAVLIKSKPDLLRSRASFPRSGRPRWDLDPDRGCCKSVFDPGQQSVALTAPGRALCRAQ